MPNAQRRNFNFLYIQGDKTPVFTMFHLDPAVYDEISTLAFHKRKGICRTMQDLMELGLNSLKHTDPAFDSVPLSGSFANLFPGTGPDNNNGQP